MTEKTKDRAPRYILTDNPHGLILFGPENPKGEPDSGTEITIASKAGYVERHYMNGNSHTLTPGKDEETVGLDINPEASEEIAKSIVAKNGDICIVAENGNIKLKAKNIYIEAEGSSNNGAFLLNANGPAVISSTDNLVLAGSKVCLRGQTGVDIVSSHMIKMLGVMSYGSPLSSLLDTLLPSSLKGLLDGVLLSCK